MKKIWINIIPWDKNLVISSLEAGVDAVFIPEGYTSKVKELGLINTIAKDGDIKLDKDVIICEINDKESEKNAAFIGKNKTIIVKTNNWQIIPLENLIADNAHIIAEVKNLEESKLVLQILEKGVEGILLNNKNPEEIKKVVNFIKQDLPEITLKEAKITEITSLGLGDRVCVDTCSYLSEGKGLLVGNSSQAMFLVHAEVVENPYVEKRPFRINAGAVHAYTLIPDNKTKYLSELKASDEVLIVDAKGKAERAIVGRIKIEKRPLLSIKAVCENKEISLILQNAETIMLTQPNGKPISVVELKKDFSVLVYLEKMGRHFGMSIEETIIEK
ncbi:MAG: 3-dehydroquinate synthase II [bacterium]